MLTHNDKDSSLKHHLKHGPFKESLKMSKGRSEAVNRDRTDNTIGKRNDRPNTTQKTKH